MATSTTSVVTSGVSAWLKRTALDRAVPFTAHMLFGDREPLPAGSGKVIKFRRYGNLTNATSALTEGVTPANKALSITDVSATLAQYGTFVTLTDVLMGSNLMALLGDTAGLLGDNAGQSLDIITRDVIVAGSTVQYVQTSGTNLTRASLSATDDLGLTAAIGNIRTAENTLDGNDAKRFTPVVPGQARDGSTPVWSSYWSIIHPNTHLTLKEATQWLPVADYGDPTAAVPGEVGNIEGVRFVQTNNAKVFSGSGVGGVDVYATLVIGQHAYAVSNIQDANLDNNLGLSIIAKDAGSSGTADPLNQRMTLGWKTFFAAARLNENFMLRIEHTAS